MGRWRGGGKKRGRKNQLHLAISESKVRKSKLEKKKILKDAGGKKHLKYRGPKIRTTFNFSEIILARKDQNEIFKVLREKNY